MPQPKFDKFSGAVLSYAKQQRDSILEQVDKYKTQKFQQAEDKVLNDVYKLMQKEMAKMRGESIREISKRELDARKLLLTRRNEITQDIFLRASQKLIEYTKSDEYCEKLKNILTKIVSHLPNDNTIYYISEKDEQYIEILLPLCPDESEIKLDKTIQIGGIKGVNISVGRMVDCTFDSALEDQQDWFAGLSGLGLL